MPQAGRFSRIRIFAALDTAEKLAGHSAIDFGAKGAFGGAVFEDSGANSIFLIGVVKHFL